MSPNAKRGSVSDKSGGIFGAFARRAAARAASVLDEAFLTVIEVEGRGSKKAVSEISHTRRVELLDDVARAYEKPEFYGSPDTFFTPPDPITPKISRLSGASSIARVRGLALNGIVDLSWESRFSAHHEPVRGKFTARKNNATAYARLMTVAPDRPVAILVHGYMGGQWAIEARQWRVSSMLRAGLNVAQFVLPFHAKRSDTVARAPVFPSADPRFNNEAFAQAIYDLRALIGFLRAEGAPHVGAMGVSLGGFTVSLLATVSRELSFCAPIIPLASIADFARARGRLGNSDDEAASQHEALERATRVVSPLARPLLVPKDRVLIVAADGDRITPLAHARRIADHFGAQIHMMHGGHLLQIDRRDGIRAVLDMLRRESLIPERKDPALADHDEE